MVDIMFMRRTGDRAAVAVEGLSWVGMLRIMGAPWWVILTLVFLLAR